MCGLTFGDVPFTRGVSQRDHCHRYPFARFGSVDDVEDLFGVLLEEQGRQCRTDTFRCGGKLQAPHGWVDGTFAAGFTPGEDNQRNLVEVVGEPDRDRHRWHRGLELLTVEVDPRDGGRQAAREHQDLVADAELTLAPLQRALVPTGLAIALPDGYEAQIRPRSGLAAKHGITCLNTPGTVDADYRGEVQVLLINLGSEPFVIKRGERMAQMVIAPVEQAAMVEVTELPPSGRGAGGFGSTGR